MGIILTITWQYYLNFPKDRFIFKFLVASVFILSLVETVVNGYWCYEWSITSYMQPAIFGVLPISLIIDVFCIGCPATQLLPSRFYLYNVSRAVRPTCYLWLVSSILADLSITASMGYYLRIRLKGQAKGTFNDIISRTIQSNILLLFTQVLAFALFKANVGFYAFLDDFTGVKIRAFSLIVSMNTRGVSTIYDTLKTSESSKPAGISLSQLSSANFRGRARPAPNVLINVHQNVEVGADSWEHSQSFMHHKLDPELALKQDEKAEAY
ncbi:hypothetical protein DXG01_011426 [Tephrocybe rancida]|nr:hypothetical protein DXG01_011426 [Tephrocybe rancida]